MSEERRVSVQPIADADVSRVARFLDEHLGARGGEARWIGAMTPPWDFPQPNHGFLLEDDGRVVGAYLALYSERTIDGRREEVCNLAAWCVLPSHRHHSVRLLRALLGQTGYHFTDLSPSGNVVPLNRRLRFETLDTTTAVVPNVPRLSVARSVRLISDPLEIAAKLNGRDLELYRDHADAVAARHLVIVRGEETCYLMYRRDRRKRLPLFASFVHVGNPALLQATEGHLRRFLLLHHAIPFTLAELRVVGYRPRLSIMLRSPRPKMYRSPTLRPDQIDYLYSELACVEW